MIHNYKIFTEPDLISAASLTLICVIKSLHVFLSHISDPVTLVSIGRLPFISTYQRVKTTQSKFKDGATTHKMAARHRALRTDPENSVRTMKLK